MNATDDPDVELWGNKRRSYFPQFLFATDGMFSIMKILELAALSGKR
jgi:hypothetical protein